MEEWSFGARPTASGSIFGGMQELNGVLSDGDMLTDRAAEAGSPDIGLSAPDNPHRHIIDVDSEVAFCFQRPVAQTPFDSPPSQQTRRPNSCSSSRQSHGSHGSGRNVDSLIELMAKVIENSQIESRRRESEMKAEIERREVEMRRRCQLEMENKMLIEKLAALENQNKSDEYDVIAMHCTQPLVVQSSTTSVVSRSICSMIDATQTVVTSFTPTQHCLTHTSDAQPLSTPTSFHPLPTGRQNASDDLNLSESFMLLPPSSHVGYAVTTSVCQAPLGVSRESSQPVDVSLASYHELVRSQRPSEAGVVWPCENWVVSRPHTVTTMPAVGPGLFAPTRIAVPLMADNSCLPGVTVLPADSQLNPRACSRDLTGLLPVTCAPEIYPLQSVGMHDGRLAARLPVTYTTTSNIGLYTTLPRTQHIQSIDLLTGNHSRCPEGSMLGNVHTLPLSAPTNTQLSTIYENDNLKQQTVPVVENDAVIRDDCLIPGLPAPPTGSVMVCQSSMVQATASTDLAVAATSSAHHYVMSVPPSLLLGQPFTGQPSSTVAASVVPAVPSTSMSGQYVTIEGSPAAMSVVTLLPSSSMVQSRSSMGLDVPVIASVVPAAPIMSSTLSGQLAMLNPSFVTSAVTRTSSTVPSSSATGIDVAAAVAPVVTTVSSTSSTAHVTVTSTTSGSSKVVGAPATSSAPPVVVVRQLQVVRPYSGSSSWQLFREHFNRVAKVNSWTTNDELVQHLTLSLEGPAAEVLRDFDDSSPTALTDLWARLEHRFGDVDGCRDAMRKFEARRQSDSETLVEFEHALRVLHKEAWPNATADQRDATLKRRFEDGVASTELSQYLRLHHRELNFAQTVERARIYHSTMDSGKAKKAVRFVADVVDQSTTTSSDLLPVINYLKGIEGRLDKLVKSDKQSLQSTGSSSSTSSSPSSTPAVPQPQSPRSRRTSVSPASTVTMSPSNRFQGPSDIRLRSPMGCYVCGQRGCHSTFHCQDGRPPRPPSPRPGFNARGRPRGCWVCGRPGCHSINHRDQPVDSPQQLSSLTPTSVASGNGSRSPIPGGRTPSQQFRPQFR